MKSTLLALSCLFAVGTTPVWAQPAAHDHGPPKNTGDVSVDNAWEAMQKLVGRWEIDGDEADHDGVIRYELTAGGAVLVERMFEGTPMEMMSVYHRDASGIAMTHYCVAGNQPQMHAPATLKEGKLVFSFCGGANIDYESGMHIHGGQIEFVGDDQLKTFWNVWQDGQLGEKYEFTLKRLPAETKEAQ